MNKSMVERNQQSNEPALSAIILVNDTYDSVRQAVSYLQAQTIVEQIEIVLVAPSYEQLKPDKSELAHFHSWQVIEVGRIKSLAYGFVMGVRKASAPVVAFVEDHSFPEENWAEVLIAAHRESWAAVGPRMCNGNPDNMLSWADFYITHGEWENPVLSGPARHLPGHNSSYKRDVLLACGDQLESLMQAEGVLHRYLRARGYQLLFNSETCTSHFHFTSWLSWIPSQYYAGRLFAATWASTWSRAQRLLFASASPLIPWIRLRRIQKHIRSAHSGGFFIHLLPVLFLGLLVNSLGQMAGYVGGTGNSAEKMVKYEFHRV